MNVAEGLAVLMVLAVCIALFVGYPVALTLGGVSLMFAVLAHLAGIMDLALLGALPQRIFGIMTNDVLLALPLFVFMGVTLERSAVAEDLLQAMGRLFGRLRGGLGISVMLVGTLLAASTGIVGATAVTMGLIALPAMLRTGYDPRLAAGSIAASATLAQIIPPSTVLVVLGDQLNNAYQAAQLAKGVFAPAAVSVSDLFAGALVPGLILVGLYIVYLLAVAFWRPASCPAVPAAAAADRTSDRPPRGVAEILLAPALLIVAVLGSILGGLATPTEAAAVGAVGAVLLAARRVAPASTPYILGGAVALGLALLLGAAASPLPAGGLQVVAVILIGLGMLGIAVALVRLQQTRLLLPVMTTSAHITAMIFAILIGATLFSLVFRGLGGDGLVDRALHGLPGGSGGAVLAVLAAVFLLGFVMDAFEIVFIVVPIVGPVLLKFPDVDPIWLGILIAVDLQTSYMHPPLGPTLFYLRGVAPPAVTTRHIYVGIVPFVLIQLLALIALWFAPGLATALPRALYGG